MDKLYSDLSGASARYAKPTTRTVTRGDIEWKHWSNVEIAKHCGVSDEYVRRLRGSLTSNVGSEDVRRKYIDKHGTQSTMDTTNIGNHMQESDAVPEPKELAPPDEILDSKPTSEPFPLRMVSQAAPPGPNESRPVFNRTNEMVEWAWFTWNPVTGCEHASGKIGFW